MKKYFNGRTFWRTKVFFILQTESTNEGWKTIKMAEEGNGRTAFIHCTIIAGKIVLVAEQIIYGIRIIIYKRAK